MENHEKIPEFIQKIDWKLLREQKQTLLRIQETLQTTPKRYDHIEGIIEFLDALQDYAADDMRLGDKLVFNLDENDTNDI